MQEEQEVSGSDVFELLQITAREIDLDAIRNNQKHPDRRRFVDEFVQYLTNYMRANKIPKPEDYFVQLKMVVSSLTDKILGIIKALQENNEEAFVALVRTLDQETLRRMGQLPKEERAGSKTDLPPELRGVTAQDIGFILGTKIDVRDIARESRRRPGLNPHSGE